MSGGDDYLNILRRQRFRARAKDDFRIKQVAQRRLSGVSRIQPNQWLVSADSIDPSRQRRTCLLPQDSADIFHFNPILQWVCFGRAHDKCEVTYTQIRSLAMHLKHNP